MALLLVSLVLDFIPHTVMESHHPPSEYFKKFSLLLELYVDSFEGQKEANKRSFYRCCKKNCSWPSMRQSTALSMWIRRTRRIPFSWWAIKPHRWYPVGAFGVLVWFIYSLLSLALLQHWWTFAPSNNEKFIPSAHFTPRRLHRALTYRAKDSKWVHTFAPRFNPSQALLFAFSPTHRCFWIYQRRIRGQVISGRQGSLCETN